MEYQVDDFNIRQQRLLVIEIFGIQTVDINNPILD